MENYTTKLGNTECSLFEGGIPLAIFGGVVVFLRSLLLRGGGGGEGLACWYYWKGWCLIGEGI